MKFVSFLIVLALVAWIAHSNGYNNGLKASPEYARALEHNNQIREAEFNGFMQRSSTYTPSDISECIPIMNEFDGDIGEYCTSLFEQYDQDRQEAREADGRSQYD